MTENWCLYMAGNLLKEYDLFHTSLLYGGKITFNINYLYDGKIYVSLVGLINGVEKKTTYDFENNDDFNKIALPKIIERYLSKNVGIKSRSIMGGDHGTLIIERVDGKDSLIIRNCSKDIMDLAKKLNEALDNLNDIDFNKGKKIIIQDESNEVYDNYMKYNLAFDYATYKNLYFKSNSTLALDIEKSINNEDDNSAMQLLILNIARYAYMFEGEKKDSLWDEIKNTYKDKKAVENICDEFKNVDLNEESLYTDALILAELEKNYDMLLHNCDSLVQEASLAVENGVSFFDDNYENYFRKKQEYYSSIIDTQREIICLDFIDCHSIGNSLQSVELKNKTEIKIEEPTEESFVDKMKNIKAKKLAFATILSEPDDVEDEDDHYKVDDFATLYDGAEDQARIIFDVIQERDQIKKDAEQFAKEIIQKEKEHKEIVDASVEQAKKLIELEQENLELKRLAAENAQEIFNKEKRMQEEERLREIIDNSPVNAQDIDKINNLLNAISSCKDIDFSVNHPTVMQELTFLEEKIITYLTTHKNVVSEEAKLVPVEQEEMLESKPVIELLSMIRNAYVTSHQYEKYGRHTVIKFIPVDEDTYRCCLYSVKDNDDDMLMDAFFEDYQLTDSVLEQLCDIFKKDAVIVASKIDNIPPDKADYLVLDNMNNAIKFMGCKRSLIDVVKQYL